MREVEVNWMHKVFAEYFGSLNGLCGGQLVLYVPKYDSMAIVDGILLNQQDSEILIRLKANNNNKLKKIKNTEMVEVIGWI